MTMFGRKIACSVLALMIWPGQVIAATEKDDYPYLDFGAISSKPSALKSNSSSGRKAKKKNEQEELPTWQQAFKELVVTPEEQSAEIVATPATVVTKIEAVKSPLAPPAFVFDFALEPYQPAGRMKISGFQAYELDTLGMRPMPSLTFRWLPVPIESENVFSSFGIFVSGAFDQHAVDLTSPTGESFRNTSLSTLKWQSGLVGTLKPGADSPWGTRVEAGLGELKIIQSSAASIANHSASEAYASFAIYGERRIWSQLSAFIGYDHRIPMGSGATEIELSRSNFKFGLSGGFN